MKILVVGSTGKVGRAWLKLPDPTNNLQITGLGGSANYNFAKKADVKLLIEKISADGPDVLVLAAAMTHVDDCERQQDLAMEINAQATAQIALACAERGVGLIFYSSDHVFDGSGPGDESGTLAPLNVYGLSKVHAEESIRSSGCKHLIVRINVPLTVEADGSNFYSFVAGRLLAAKTVRIVTDQWNNPLDTARIAHWSLEAWRYGLFDTLHLGGGSYMTRFDIARSIASHLQIDPKLIEPITSDQLDQFAPRPRRGGLLIARQSELFGTAPDLPTILNSIA